MLHTIFKIVALYRILPFLLTFYAIIVLWLMKEKFKIQYIAMYCRSQIELK